ncbi:MAG: hypothetical protein AABY51_08035 [Deltaproteobacteria bacterium]
MNKELRPVSIGLILGIVGLLSGILWAMYIVVGHEAIHDRLSGSIVAPHESPAMSAPVAVEDHHKEADAKDASDHHSHKTSMPAEGHPHGHSAPHGSGAITMTVSGHDSPIMEAAHERLTRGHLHAMGLGTIAVVISLVLAFLHGPNWLKTIASASLGVGGLIYPLSWIIMGFRTPALGIEGAHESVFMIVAASAPLVIGGLGITLILILKGIFSSR